MSFADEEELRAFIHRDHVLPWVTPEAVALALDGFSLQLSSSRTIDWLAMAVRRALGNTARRTGDGPRRPSNSEIRAELTRLAEAVQAAWGKVFDRSEASDSRLWDHAFRHWEGVNALATSDDPGFAYNRFRTALADLDWMSGFLRAAAQETEPQRGAWRRAEERRIRVERGQYLAPVFEATFGEAVTANNWPSDARHSAPTPFMDFYQRMVALAFAEQATPDLSGILKAASRLHRNEPVEFVQGAIPGL